MELSALRGVERQGDGQYSECPVTALLAEQRPALARSRARPAASLESDAETVRGRSNGQKAAIEARTAEARRHSHPVHRKPSRPANLFVVALNELVPQEICRRLDLRRNMWGAHSGVTVSSLRGSTTRPSCRGCPYMRSASNSPVSKRP